MDRKEKLKYSLLEVFGLDPSGSSETQSLMESYGVTPVRISPRAGRRTAVELIREAIETGVVPLVEAIEPEPPARGAQRDDIALQRWREMAGLDDEGGSQ
jgi:hypothetical protein